MLKLSDETCREPEHVVFEVLVVIVVVSIASLKVTVREVFGATEEAESAGEDEETVGAVVSVVFVSSSVVVVLVVLLAVVELPKSLSFPENPHPEKYIKMGSKKTNNFNLANIRTPFQIQ